MPVNLQGAVGRRCGVFGDCRVIILQEMSSKEGTATAPPSVHLDIIQVLLDVPQRVGTGLQLGHLIVCQGHVDHAGHSSIVQHAGQTQIHLVTDSIHALHTINNNLTVCGRLNISKTEISECNMQKIK